MTWHARRRAAQGIVLCLCLGCTPSGRNVTWVHVQGTVTCDGKPVSEGTIQFHDTKTGEAPQADLNPDGSYNIRVPAAEYAVAVVPLLVDKSTDGMPNWVYKKTSEIPSKYQNPAKSGFTADVQPSTAQFDFMMTKSR